MDLVNLAHGVQYMLGAYSAVLGARWTGSFCARPAAGRRRGRSRSGCLLDALVFRRLLGARPSRPGAGDLRADPAVRGGRARRCSARRRSSPAAAGRARRHGAAAGRAALPGLPRWSCWRRGWRRRRCSGLVIERTRAGMLVRAGASNAADPGGAGRRCRPAVRAGDGGRGDAGRVRRRAAAPLVGGRARHGRQRADPRLRRDRGRRRRLGARRVRRRAAGRPDRHARAASCIGGAAAPRARALGGAQGGAGAGVDG